MYRLIFRAKSLHNSWPPSTVMTPKSTFQITTLNRQQPSDPSTFNVVLETSVTRHPLWERSISIPHWWGEVCVYLGPLCARVCVCVNVSATLQLVTQIQLDCWWWVEGVCACMSDCAVLHNAHWVYSCVVMSELRRADLPVQYNHSP